MRERLLEPFAQQQPVGQVGERVVMRHMGDFDLRPLLRVMSWCTTTHPPPAIG